MGMQRIVRAKLDGIDCIVLRVVVPEEKMDLLKASHYSELYIKGGIPVEAWVGMSIMERRHLAIFVYNSRWNTDIVGDMMFFAKIPELRFESRHPEWGEPEGRHYAIPISFPASKVVFFAEELGQEEGE